MRLDIARQARRRALQGQDDLPPCVETAIVVEPVAGVLQSKADEHKARSEAARLGGHAGPERGILALLQRYLLAANGQRQLRRLARRGAAERDLLEPAALLACRLEPDRPELRRDIVGGNRIAFGSRVAAFQAVRSQELDIGAYPPRYVLFDRGRGGGLRRRGTLSNNRAAASRRIKSSGNVRR